MGRSFRKKWLLVFAAILFTIFFALCNIQVVEYSVLNDEIQVVYDGLTNAEVQRWWNLRNDTKKLTKLGRILFLDEDAPKINTSRKYQILVWKYGKAIENRHLKQFSDKKLDPFAHCSVRNCDITYSDSAIDTADIVIFHLQRIKGLSDMPKKRNPEQIWAFLTDESPYHTFINSKKVKLKDFNGMFNWSMTYRMDSDIPVPYGRTVRTTNPIFEITLTKRRDVLAAILTSSCTVKSHRLEYIKELQKYLKVDIYGKCGTLKTCPGHFKSNCVDIDKYLFYLSFENSNCDEYITEKLWWNAFEKNSIPIVMGAPKKDYEKLLPPNSYINIEDFSSPFSLAQFILRLNQTGEFSKYYEWKKNFKVLNEHGYFQSKSVHYCRVCEALNYNNRSNKVYENLETIWSTKNCYPPWDQ